VWGSTFTFFDPEMESVQSVELRLFKRKLTNLNQTMVRGIKF
jgi:hypothetical protein